MSIDLNRKHQAISEILAAIETIENALPALSKDERTSVLNKVQETIIRFNEKEAGQEIQDNGDNDSGDTVLPSPSIAIKKLLKSLPDGLKPSEIVKALDGKFKTKGDSSAVAYASIAYLKGQGIIEKSDDGRYRYIPLNKRK
jgi:hypothetical protein